MKKSIIFLIIIGIIASAVVLVDIFAKGVAERAVASSLEQSLELEEQPQVAIDGFPFIVNLLKGVLPEVTLDAEGLGEGRIRFDSATLTLENVRFEAGTLISGDPGAIEIGGGRGSAQMSDRTLTRALKREGADIVVAFIDGSVQLTSPSTGIEGEGQLSVEGSSLVLTSDALPGSFSINLPEIAGGITYRSVEVGNGLATLIVGLSRGTFELPQG